MTGGVITSAGLVLAATFTVLGTLPLVFLAQLGFAVALGVLLDTLVVRSVLVTALNLDLGSKIWWPSKLDRGGPVEDRPEGGRRRSRLLSGVLDRRQLVQRAGRCQPVGRLLGEAEEQSGDHDERRKKGSQQSDHRPTLGHAWSSGRSPHGCRGDASRSRRLPLSPVPQPSQPPLLLADVQKRVAEELDRLAPVIDELGARFEGAGEQLALVGGPVRDAMLGRLQNDLDFTTSAHPDVTERLLKGWADAVWDLGKEFGTIGARKGDWQIEITTWRSESYDPASRKPSVEYGTSRTEIEPWVFTVR